MGIRVDYAGKSYVHASDYEHGISPPDDLIAFARGADFMAYDAAYVDGEEYERHRGWGHSTWREGLGIAKTAGVGRFIAFHPRAQSRRRVHGPHRGRHEGVQCRAPSWPSRG